MSTIPRPRDKATVISVAVEGVPLTWVGPPLGAPGKGELAGDGSNASRALVQDAHALWKEPIQVDHPSWKHPFYTTDETPEGVLVTLLHLGAGRAVPLDVPPPVLDDVLMDADAANIQGAEDAPDGE